MKRSEDIMSRTPSDDAPTIGHNGGPDMDRPVTKFDWYRLVGPRVRRAIAPFKCGAPWTGHATDAELRRLGSLQAQIDRKELTLREMKAQRHTIMRRCIRRMRRKDGKA